MSYPPVCQYLPHRGEAVLLEEILDLQDHCLTARVKAVAAGDLPLILIEAAAQAAAVLQGVRLAGSGRRPAPGYLAGVRDFRWLHPGQASEPVQVEVREVKSLPPFFSFAAEIRQPGRLVAAGALTVFAGGA